VGIDYRRPHQGQTQHTTEQPTATGTRPDITSALAAVPPNIRAQLHGEAAAALDLLNRYLPPDEPVRLISSVAVTDDAPPNSVLAVTDHRLVFVAPAPQAVAWRLSSLTKIQLYLGFFFLHGDAGEYSLGLANDAWGATVQQHVKTASAIAVLAGR
jgi:hypothetical protein